MTAGWRKSSTFQSTLPVRGATPGTDQRTGQRQISIHAPREGSDLEEVEGLLFQAISIHAPREGSDGIRYRRQAGANISIHAPREGSDSRFGV